MKSPRFILIAIASILVLGPLLWLYVIRPPLARSERWEGVIVERFEKAHGGNFKYHTYHWRVECEDGATRSVDVDTALYTSVRVGDRVCKLKGDRYPRPVGRSGLNLLEEQMGDEFPDRLRHLVPVEE